MKEAANDNEDTWTHIAVAAARVLTKINEFKDEMTSEQAKADRRQEEADHEAHHDARDAVLIENRKLAR